MHKPQSRHEQEESSSEALRAAELTTNDLFRKNFSGLSTIQAQYLASSVFGIDGQASILTSERDQNFKISTDQGRAFVLKVTHPSEDPGVTDFQTQAQSHIMNNGPDVPFGALGARKVFVDCSLLLHCPTRTYIVRNRSHIPQGYVEEAIGDFGQFSEQRATFIRALGVRFH